jgi:hypothetical protein
MRITEHIDLSLNAKDLKRIGRIGGWAPGAYMGRCLDCRAEIVAAKRATQCLPCATKAAMEAATTWRDASMKLCDALDSILHEDSDKSEQARLTDRVIASELLHIVRSKLLPQEIEEAQP